MRENFLYTEAVVDNYNFFKNEIKEMTTPIKKKRYTDLKKLLQECYFVGSPRFGTNFIA